MAVKSKPAEKTVSLAHFPKPQGPILLRSHRLMDAFAKSDDERDFYVDRLEGFILFVNLDAPDEELRVLDEELRKNGARYCQIPKLTYYETKKIMEGFVNEKVYDIDTKEKLLEVIQSKEARENFLEFIYDHHTELEKWHQYYQERSRIRIIEWLRNNQFEFVFEEDLDLPKVVVEKVKRAHFQAKVAKDIQTARDALYNKSRTYYSNEALNPRPKRGRPPKQVAKVEVEPELSSDLYTTVPASAAPFLYVPDITSASSISFSSKYKTEEELLANLRSAPRSDTTVKLELLSQKLESLRKLSESLQKGKDAIHQEPPRNGARTSFIDDEFEEEEEIVLPIKKVAPIKVPVKTAAPAPIKKATPPPKPVQKKPPIGKRPHKMRPTKPGKTKKKESPKRAAPPAKKKFRFFKPKRRR